MATLRELWHAVVPSARPIGSTDDARWDVTVGWVRVLRPRVPAFDALDAGEVAIVPASALVVVAPGPAELSGLVAAFVAAPVAGVLIVEGEVSDGLGSELGGRLAQAAAAAGLASLIADRVDPRGLERSAIGYLVNRRAELERQAAGLERQLGQLALAGRGLDSFAAAIGTFLDRAVAIERRRGDALAIHAPAGLPSRAADVARYHARPSAVSLRVPLPAGPGADAAPVGSLVILGDELVGERDRIACDRIAPLLALEIARGGRGARGVTRFRADALPAGGPPWVVYVARQGPLGPEGDALEQRESLRREVTLLAAPDRLTLRGDAESLELRAVAAVSPDDPDGIELAARIALRLGSRTVAVSRGFLEPAGRPVAEAESRSTLEAAERLPDPPAVARADRLAAYRLLGSLPDLPDASRQARALLEPLLVGRPAAQRQRLATLRAVLDRETTGEVASVLGVHRNTVAYRVRRIEELAGWDLRDPELRLALAIAVRMVQSAQVEITKA
jgi:hypothetical protein